MSEERKLKLSDQALGSVMMALQESLLNELDIVPILRGFELAESENGLMVLNPPTVRVSNETPITEEDLKKESLLKSLKPEVVKGTAENFEKWWQSLPEKRKVNKKGCLEKWKSKKLDDISKKIISWTATMKKTREWLEGFNPSPEVIINQERWNDNPKSPTQIRGAL